MPASARPQRVQAVHLERIGGSFCVYDRVRQQVHTLNDTAARVWLRCDGQSSVSDLASMFHPAHSREAAEDLVRLTLHVLTDAKLLSSPDDTGPAPSARELVDRGMAENDLPAVTSVVAPLPASSESNPAAMPVFTFSNATGTHVTEPSPPSRSSSESAATSTAAKVEQPALISESADAR